MIKTCLKEDENLVLSYIGDEYPRCLYLYLNLKKYGLGSGIVDAYMQYYNNNIVAVLLKYYSCIHVFSRDDSFEPEELCGFIQQIAFSMVYCATSTAKRLFSHFSSDFKEKSTVSTGWVAQIDTVDREPRGMAIHAQPKDFKQIVQLIYDDEDIGRSYQYDELVRQLEERNRENYARNIVIKQNDLVIAHACTNAEIGGIAVVAELLVRKEFRGKGYASEIWRDICNKLLLEGKKVYSFYYSEESRALHRKIGFYEICSWSKIIINHAVEDLEIGREAL